MRLLRSARWILMTLLLSLVPASSYAGVFISVGFAPPVLPVYEQPPCPEPGWMWTPGYWAYGEDGYYWVPGSWVPAPYEGALWTPGYWGYESDLYMWHPGYWGRHVGYYGGVNYGFGYMGVGFVGGLWRGHDFVYNTAVVRVDRGHIRNVYEDRRIVERNTIVNERRVAFSGGPGGIRHEPGAEERMAMHEQHMAPTSFQTQHRDAAMADRNSWYRNNNGRPQNLAVARPMVHDEHMGPSGQTRPNQPNTFNRGQNNSSPGAQNRPDFQNNQQHRPTVQNNQQPQQYRGNQENQIHPAPQYQMQHNNNENRPQDRPQFNRGPQNQPQMNREPQNQPQFNRRPENQPQMNRRPENQPQMHQGPPQGQPHNEGRPQGQPHNEGHPQGRPEHDNHDHPHGR